MSYVNRRFVRALFVGLLVAAAGVVMVKLTGVSEAWNWAVLLVALLAASLADREGFYGAAPRSRH